VSRGSDPLPCRPCADILDRCDGSAAPSDEKFLRARSTEVETAIQQFGSEPIGRERVRENAEGPPPTGNGLTLSLKAFVSCRKGPRSARNATVPGSRSEWHRPSANGSGLAQKGSGETPQAIGFSLQQSPKSRRQPFFRCRIRPSAASNGFSEAAIGDDQVELGVPVGQRAVGLEAG
jgi:hypothetical protein